MHLCLRLLHISITSEDYSFVRDAECVCCSLSTVGDCVMVVGKEDVQRWKRNLKLPERQDACLQSRDDLLSVLWLFFFLL